jgi:hypothetical protein
VEKRNQANVSARILHPASIHPVMAVGHEMDMGLIAPILAKARQSLAEVTP